MRLQFCASTRNGLQLEAHLFRFAAQSHAHLAATKSAQKQAQKLDFLTSAVFWSWREVVLRIGVASPVDWRSTPHRCGRLVDTVCSNALINGHDNFSVATKLLILRGLSGCKVGESALRRRITCPFATLPHLFVPQPTGLAALWPWPRCATAGLIRP